MFQFLTTPILTETMAEGSCVAVSDRMKYGIKPSAVQSKTIYTTLKLVTDPVFL